MTLHHLLLVITDFVRTHQAWGIPVVFTLAFCESLAFISLLVPATFILLGLGVLFAETGMPFWPIWSAAVIGAFLGDWVSYWFGFHFKGNVAHMWPFTKKPQLLIRGHQFFERWGVLGVFIGRFFGPLRSVTPLVAGICAMPQRYFQLANLASALVWGSGILAPGFWGLHWLAKWFN